MVHGGHDWISDRQQDSFVELVERVKENQQQNMSTVIFGISASFFGDRE